MAAETVIGGTGWHTRTVSVNIDDPSDRLGGVAVKDLGSRTGNLKATAWPCEQGEVRSGGSSHAALLQMFDSLLAVEIAVFTSGPAAGPALTVFEFFLRAADATFSCRGLFGVEHPADELVAGQRGDVLPRRERGRVGDQRSAQVGRHLVHDATWYALAEHRITVTASHAGHLSSLRAGADQ